MKTEKSDKYDAFQFHEEQRKHSRPAIDRLKLSMLKWGFLEEKPIMVLRLSPGKYKVVDGHTRLETARQLGIPFYYVVMPEKFSDAVGDMNIINWPLKAVVDRYAQRGLQDYIELLEYMKYGIAITAATSLLNGNLSYSSNSNEVLRSGSWKIKTRKNIDVVVKFMVELGDICPSVKNAKFHAALSMCLFVQEFDPERMLHKLRMNPRMLEKTATREQMLTQMEEIYNYKANAASKLPIFFMAKTSAKERSIACMNG